MTKLNPPPLCRAETLKFSKRLKFFFFAKMFGRSHVKNPPCPQNIHIGQLPLP